MTSLAPYAEAERFRPPRVTAAAFGASTVALAFALTLLPMLPILCIVGIVVITGVVAAVPGRTSLFELPDAISDPQLRQTYTAVLGAAEQLELAIAGAPRFRMTAHSLRERSAAAVHGCAQLAPVASAVHARLSGIDAWRISQQAGQLRARARNEPDQATARALAAAADACDKQLAACAELMHVRNRVQARYELVLESLRAFTTAIIEQQAREDEQLVLATDGVAEALCDVRDDLETSSTALALE